ncbi:MAG: restriction endonuclease subunit S [Planctomycetaceae bacterium]|nr:restriction endonuclease subunit S [Planctomycetaceae bacterium]
MLPLAETCSVFADGDWVESKDQSEDGIRLIQTGNVGLGYFKDRGDKARYISEATFGRLRCTEIFEGDCLISRLPDPVGRSCLLPNTNDRMITAVDCTIVRFDRKKIIPEFFNYYSQSHDYLERVESRTTGTTRKRISRSKLGQTLIVVPPLAEQRRIVGILDEAFAGIAVAKRNAEQNLQNARALFESHLQAIFTQRGDGWVTKTVKEIASKGKGSIRTGPFGSQLLHSEFVEKGVAVLGIDNAVANEFRWGKSRFITAEKFRQLERFRVHPGDVIITIMGTCGRCAIVPDDIQTAINTKHLCCITLDHTQCLPSYLHLYFLLAPQAREHLAKHAKGAIMAGLNMGIIQELPVLLPPTGVQASIVNAADALREKTQRLAALYQQKLTALDELKKSLLARAFAGELTSDAVAQGA